MKRLCLGMLSLLAFLSLPAVGQIFDCSGGFTTSPTSAVCGIGILGPSGTFEVVGSQNGSSPGLSGSALVFPTASDHIALSLMYQTAVDVRAFTTTFTFIPNGQNVSFTINNCPSGSCGGFHGKSFSSGASCEGGFYQGFTGNPFPIDVFALMFDSYATLVSTDSDFTYSSVQIYQEHQSPCNPTSGGSQPYWSTTKLSTSPVPLNSPAGTQNTTTGDTYSATLIYDGSTLTLNLFDVNAGGSCPGASCFTHTWSNVSIPSEVDGTTGYIGMVLSTGEGSVAPMEIKGWIYTVNAATASPGSTVTSAGSPTATSPTFSPAAGSYSGTQTVAITGSNVCYALGASGLTILPLADQLGGCAIGTLYSGPVTVSSSQTLYAAAGLNGTGLSSGVVQGAYTIGGAGAASAPTFSPAAGTYSGTQTATASTSTSGCGSYIYFDTNSTPTTNQTSLSVASSETVYAYVHGCPGYTDSSVANAAYTITTPPTAAPAGIGIFSPGP